MLIQQNAVLFLAVSLPALVMCGVPHSHGVKKGHAEREDDGAYRFLATFSYSLIMHYKASSYKIFFQPTRFWSRWRFGDL